MMELNRTLIFQIINFLVLMVFLYLFLFKPIRRFLVRRADSIQQALNESEASRREAEQKLSEYNALLSQAGKKMEAMREAAEREALEERRQTLKEAKEESRKMIEEAKAEIEEAVKGARQELKQEMVEITTALAEKVIKRSLQEEDQHRLIRESIEQLKEEQ